MADFKPPKSYIDSFFGRPVWWEGKEQGAPCPKILISLGIDQQLALEELAKQPTSTNERTGKAFINLTMGSSKDGKKISTWYQPYEGNKASAKPPASYAANNPSPLAPTVVGPSDDLPF